MEGFERYRGKSLLVGITYLGHDGGGGGTMAAWFTVYRSRSVDHVTAADIRSEIDRWDFPTAAEAYGIDDDEAVGRAVASLKLEPLDGPGPVRFRLSYGPPNRRPILIHVLPDPELVEEVREEAKELLDRARGEGEGRIRSHLSGVAEVVALELGWSQLRDMGVVLAGMVSEYFAIIGAGLIRDPYDVWWAVENHCPIRLAGPE
jgi:hypothetical protein